MVLWRRGRPPTDFELLHAIYTRHRDDYLSFVKGAADGRTPKIAVPIDILAIANGLGVDADSVFGRLYYNLDPLYETRNEDGSRKSFFIPRPGEEQDLINFPLLEAVLAGLWLERRRDLRTFWAAAASVGIATGSLVVSIFAAAA